MLDDIEDLTPLFAHEPCDWFEIGKREYISFMRNRDSEYDYPRRKCDALVRDASGNKVRFCTRKFQHIGPCVSGAMDRDKALIDWRDAA